MSVDPNITPASPGGGVLQRRLVVVTGKGGTGKTTLAASVASALQGLGRRVLVVELGGSHGLADLFALPRKPYEILAVEPGLSMLSISPEAALQEFVLRQVKLPSIFRLVFRNRITGPFIDAVPALPDIIQLGKVWDLAQEPGPDGGPRWDHLVLDAPATGHGLSMLSSPRVLMDLTGGGPFFKNAAKVQGLFGDPLATAVVLTSLPEEVPLNETIDLHRHLGALGLPPALCVLNQQAAPPFHPLSAWERARPHLPDGPAWREARALTDGAVERARAGHMALERLRLALGCPVVPLPRLLTSSPTLERSAVTVLSEVLMGSLEAA